jgi:hypothetical protein
MWRISYERKITGIWFAVLLFGDVLPSCLTAGLGCDFITNVM